MAGGSDAVVQQQTASSGRIGQIGRLNYSLHERVVPLPEHPQVHDKVVSSRQHVQEHYHADILGLRGPQWDASVHAFPGKHCQAGSDQRLSNTLLPMHIPSTADFRRTQGTTHSPVQRLEAPQLPRNAPGAQGGWNASTSVDRREMLQGAVQVTERSVRSTRTRTQELLSGSPGAADGAGHAGRRYQSPLELAAQLTVRMREAKAAGRQDSQALEQRYGEEGAAAMRAIMKLAVWQRQELFPEEAQARRRRAGRSRPSPTDLAAVAALPDDLVPPIGVRSGSAEQQQQQQQQEEQPEPLPLAPVKADQEDLVGAAPQAELLGASHEKHQHPPSEVSAVHHEA